MNDAVKKFQTSDDDSFMEAPSSPTLTSRAASPPPSNLIKAGTMTKVGGFRKNWKSRYFKLFEHKLEYYASSGLKGSISLSSVREVRRGEAEPKLSSRVKASPECHFLLATPKRVYVFGCASNTEREVNLLLFFFPSSVTVSLSN